METVLVTALTLAPLWTLVTGYTGETPNIGPDEFHLAWG